MMIREIHNHKPSFFNFRTNEIAKDILYSFVVPFFSAYIHSHIFVNVNYSFPLIQTVSTPRKTLPLTEHQLAPPKGVFQTLHLLKILQCLNVLPSTKSQHPNPFEYSSKVSKCRSACPQTLPPPPFFFSFLLGNGQLKAPHHRHRSN